MPFNASGFFQRLFKWRDDRDAGVKILAERMDQEMDGIVDGINQVVQGQVDFKGPLVGVNGTPAAPAYSFTDETDTGVYRVSTGVLGFAVGGVKKAQLSSSGLDVSGDASFSGNVTGVTKTHVGLSNVDNTADVDKPVSTAQQAAIDGKVSKSGDTMTGHLTIDFAGPELGFFKSTDAAADARLVLQAANGAHGYSEWGQRSGGDAYAYCNGFQWTFRTDGYFIAPVGIQAPYINSTGNIHAAGDFITPQRLIVGEGQTSSIIEMRDTDEGTRYVHNNSSTIGFLDTTGAWTFRVQDDGNFWSSMFGWASEWIVRDLEHVVGIGLSSNTTPYFRGNDNGLHWLADRNANCQYNSGVVEFSGYDTGISGSVGQCSAPYVVIGLRRGNVGQDNVTYLRAVILRNN